MTVSEIYLEHQSLCARCYSVDHSAMDGRITRCEPGKKLVRAAADEQRTFRVDLGKMDVLILRGIRPQNYFSKR
jgi:hypothetical protein